MKSMTGYGKAVVCDGELELTVELKSVNHRFLDVATKASRIISAHEDVIRSVIGRYVVRGHVDVFVNYRLLTDSDKKVSVDVGLARGYAEAAKTLREEFPQLHDDFTVTSLMKCAEVLSLEQEPLKEEQLRLLLEKGVSECCVMLDQMRCAEGEKLKEDILKKLGVLRELISQAEKSSSVVVENYREKLTRRIEEALKEVQLDQSRLANEVCFFADKCCIDEELTRLKTHVENAEKIIAQSGAVGKKLDFLVQEFNREANTICSKSSDVQLTQTALDMKNEIEKIREQVQNLE
ncbi:MAG TPA: YicC family protein [Candidatus Fimimonas merdipullorum]|uniref:YicC family protein n=1 Tax=Candidatus Fimimonas merdipullorum TaxID=2840822 RepID=A0A9D1MXQ8_9BACT|nr:YicC family protein [Candidatus Fimimonas merdipullorum]